MPINKRKIRNTLFVEYYTDWINLYKKDAIRETTLQTYYQTLSVIKKLWPKLLIKDLDRQVYQSFLNEYAKTHEKTTVQDLHHHVKACIFDLVDDGVIQPDPTRRIIIKGRKMRNKKAKFLNMFELQKLLGHLDLGSKLNWDWFIYLVAKTGLRFAEALGLTPSDFDMQNQQIIINKTWNYKQGTRGFMPTKNRSSNRKVLVDWKLMQRFYSLFCDLPKDEPFFVNSLGPSNIYNSTVNYRLEHYCRQLNIPIISIHSLRHTHASLLLYEGVSIASVARRLGHANMTTTQRTYLHIIQELENKDDNRVMHHLAQLQ